MMQSLFEANFFHGVRCDSSALTELYATRQRLWTYLSQWYSSDDIERLLSDSVPETMTDLRYCIDELNQLIIQAEAICYPNQAIAKETVDSGCVKPSHANSQSITPTVSPSVDSPSMRIGETPRTSLVEEAITALTQKYDIDAEKTLRFFSHVIIGSHPLSENIYAQLLYFVHSSQFSTEQYTHEYFPVDPKAQEILIRLFTHDVFRAYVQHGTSIALRNAVSQLRDEFESSTNQFMQRSRSGPADVLTPQGRTRQNLGEDNPEPAYSAGALLKIRESHELAWLTNRLRAIDSVKNLIIFLEFWDSSSFSTKIREKIQPLVDAFRLDLSNLFEPSST